MRQPVAAIVSKDRWLATLPEYLVHSYDVEERVIDVDGDVAAVLHRARMHATVGGLDRSGAFIVTDIWRRRDGQRRVWKRHSTPLTAGPMPVRNPSPDLPWRLPSGLRLHRSAFAAARNGALCPLLRIQRRSAS